MHRDTRHLALLGAIFWAVAFALDRAGLWPAACEAMRQAAYRVFGGN